MKKGILLLIAVVVSACTQAVTADEKSLTAAPHVEFDPTNKVIPFPNNLLLNPDTGLLNIPEGCNESATATSLRTNVLNLLDGYGTYQVPINATLSEAIDVSTVAGNAFLINMQTGARVDVAGVAGTQSRWDPGCNFEYSVDTLYLVSAQPLDSNTYYAVALTSGIKTAAGADMVGSATWAFVRQKTNPVTIDANGHVSANNTPFSISGGTDNPDYEANMTRLQGIDLLWNAHKDVMAFLEVEQVTDATRSNVLLAWGFKTQTTSETIDPDVENSAAANTADETSNTATLTHIISDAAGIEQHILNEIHEYFHFWIHDPDDTSRPWKSESSPHIAWSCDTEVGYGPALPCSDVGAILHGRFMAPNYQGEFEGYPGFWSPPAAPHKAGGNEELEFVAMIPSTPPPAEGYPLVVIGHGIGNSKEQSYTQAPFLTQAGFAVVAIDKVAQGRRAVPVSDSAADGCDDLSAKPRSGWVDAEGNVTTGTKHCYAPILNTLPMIARDNFRQSILDELKLIEVVKHSCSVGAQYGCGPLVIDTNRMGYMALSLGVLLGSSVVSLSEDIKASALSVGGAGWVKLLETTADDSMRCPIINGFIDSGILSGVKWAGDDSVGALCQETCLDPTNPSCWRVSKAWLSLSSTFQWILDPGDSANYVTQLKNSDRKVLLQRVANDATVPAGATQALGGLLGLTEANASAEANSTASPSVTDAATANTSQWLLYDEVEADAGLVKGYRHAALVYPSPEVKCLLPGHSGVCNADEITIIDAYKLGTRQMQTDAIEFLKQNLPAAGTEE